MSSSSSYFKAGSNVKRGLCGFAVILTVTVTIAAALIFSPLDLRANKEGGRYPVSIKSADTAILVELFTSEGCSSCPPADRWMSSLQEHRDLWKEIIPVAWHVNYWDYIGWKDKYASQEYTARQREFRSLGLSSGVYTPGLFAQGREWRSWFGYRNIDEKRRAAIQKYGKAKYSISGLLRDRENANLSFSPAAKSRLTLEAVILGFDIETDVRRGENRGKTLEHNFVVLHHEQWPIAKNQVDIHIRIPSDNQLENKAPKYGIAFWLRERESLVPLAVAGSWLNKE